MTITLDGTTGITSPNDTTGNQSYTGTLTGGTGVVNLGSGQFYKDASGNVGIGLVSTGAAKLEINSTGTQVNITDQTSTGNGNKTVTLAAFKNGVGYHNLQYTAYQHIWQAGGSVTEAARIDSGGNLLVGTTSNSALQNNNSFIIRTVGDNIQNHVAGTASGSGYTFFGYNGGAIGSITQNGTTGVLYNLTSDYRLKDNAIPLTGASKFIMALQPKSWDWWDGSGKGVGFIAHEFMEVAKYSGNGKKDEIEIVDDVDAEGKIIGTKEVPKYQSIQPSSSEVMANLVALVQEQQALIESLTTRLTVLEAK